MELANTKGRTFHFFVATRGMGAGEAQEGKGKRPGREKQCNQFLGKEMQPA